MTQQKLAERTGLSMRTISYVEAGRDVKMSTLVKLAKALGVPIGDLFPKRIQKAS